MNNFYVIKWSPSLAYVVGLITTDGNLSSDGRHIIFVSKDAQLIELFKNILILSNKICQKESGFKKGSLSYYIQFSNVLLYRWLLGIGLTPHKSKTVAGLKIPNKYFFDFLRGHFDGDGTCYGYWDKRWHSSFMFYTKFISASKAHINWIGKNIKKSIGISGKITKEKRTGVYHLTFAKDGSKKLISKMYYKKNLPCLKRKYVKLKKIIKIDNKENGGG